MDLGVWEIAIIAVVILVLFGSTKLPQAARSLGRSMRIFKSETKGLIGDDDETPATPGTGTESQQMRDQAAALREQAARLEQQAGTQPQLGNVGKAGDGATVNGVPLTQPERGKNS